MNASARPPQPDLPNALDRVGMAASLLCAVHCALLPIVLVVLPSVGASLALGDRIELPFVAIASLVGLFSLVRGFLRHRVGRALVLLVPGLALLWTGIGWAPLHESVVPHAMAMALGGSLVAAAHMLNARYARRWRLG